MKKRNAFYQPRKKNEGKNEFWTVRFSEELAMTLKKKTQKDVNNNNKCDAKTETIATVLLIEKDE